MVLETPSRAASIRTLQCVLPSPGRVVSVVSSMRCSTSGVNTLGERFRLRTPVTAATQSLMNAARTARTVAAKFSVVRQWLGSAALDEQATEADCGGQPSGENCRYEPAA